MRYGDHLVWKIAFDKLNASFKPQLTEMTQRILKEIDRYFEQPRRDLMQKIAFLLDPNDDDVHFEQWILDVTMQFWKARRREIDCDELDALCGL